MAGGGPPSTPLFRGLKAWMPTSVRMTGESRSQRDWSYAGLAGGGARNQDCLPVGASAPIPERVGNQDGWYHGPVIVVVAPPGVSPFACSVGVRPGFFQHGENWRATGGHGEECRVNRQSAAGHPSSEAH